LATSGSEPLMKMAWTLFSQRVHNCATIITGSHGKESAMTPLGDPNHRTPSRKPSLKAQKPGRTGVPEDLTKKSVSRKRGIRKCSVCGTPMVFSGTWVCPRSRSH
jgi:hypothetical protein